MAKSWLAWTKFFLSSSFSPMLNTYHLLLLLRFLFSMAHLLHINALFCCCCVPSVFRHFRRNWWWWIARAIIFQLFECERVRIKIEKGLYVWPTATAHDEDSEKLFENLWNFLCTALTINNSLRSLNFSFKYPDFLFGCSSNLAQVNTKNMEFASFCHQEDCV